MGDVALHLLEVIEALVPLGVGGGLPFGQHGLEAGRDEGGVFHLVLGVAGMDDVSRHLHLGGGGVEVLVLQFAQLTAVHGVRQGCAKGGDVEGVGPVPHLLVRGEADAQLAVGHLRVGLEILHQGHDLGHAGLVVRPQEGGAVGDDQVLPQVLVQTLVYVGAHGHAQGLVEDDGPAVVVLHDPGPDPRAAGLGGGVHMGDQPQCRGILTARGGGNDGKHVAVLAEAYVLGPDGPKLVRQLSGQRHLARRAGNLIRVLRGHGINGYIAHKTVNYFRHTKSLLFLDSMGPVDPVASPRADDK